MENGDNKYMLIGGNGHILRKGAIRRGVDMNAWIMDMNRSHAREGGPLGC